MGAKHKYNVLAYWRENADPHTIREGSDTEQELAVRLSAAGRACVRGALRSVHRAHGHTTVAMTNGDTRPERDQIKQLQVRLKPRYTVWSIYYPAGATGETLTSMLNGLRGGAEVLEEERAHITAPHTERGLSLPGPDDTGTSHYTGALYVPEPRMRLGDLWLPEELVRLSDNMPAIPLLQPGPQQPLPPPGTMPQQI